MMRYGRLSDGNETPTTVQSEIFSRQSRRGPQHWQIPQGPDCLFTGRARGCGLLHPEGQGESHCHFGARQGSSRRNSAAVLGGQSSPHSTYIQAPGDNQHISAGALCKAMVTSKTLHGMLLKFVQVFMVQTAHTGIANPQAKLRWFG